MSLRQMFADFEYVNPGSLERRASTGLKLLAGIYAFGVVLAFVPPNPPVSTLSTVAFNAATAVLVALMVVTVLAIDREEGWAIAAIRPLVALVGLAGLAILALTLLDGRLRVPIDVLIAGWVLLGRPDTRPMPRADRRTVGVVGAAALLLGMMVVAGRLFAWGGALDVHPPELRATLAADCASHVPGDPLPETIQLSYDWSWTTWRPLPSGIDVVVIGWDGNDGAGKVQYFTGQIPDPDDGIYPGLRAYPSSAMAATVMKETRNHWVWGIRLDEQGYEPGRVDMQLHLVNRVPPTEPLRIVATYIHEGVWRQDSATITCTW